MYIGLGFLVISLGMMTILLFRCLLWKLPSAETFKYRTPSLWSGASTLQGLEATRQPLQLEKDEDSLVKLTSGRGKTSCRPAELSSTSMKSQRSLGQSAPRKSSLTASESEREWLTDCVKWVYLPEALMLPKQRVLIRCTIDSGMNYGFKYEIGSFHKRWLSKTMKSL